jgi:DNA repair exonuclease SbcCD ATPase subunit
MENSETILQEKAKVDSGIQDGELHKEDFIIQLKELTEVIESTKGIEEDWKKLQEAKEKEDKLDREISQLHNQLSTKETEEVRLESQLTQLEKLIEEYVKNEEQIKKNNEIRKEIQLVEQDIQNSKKYIQDTDEQILSLNGKISSLQSQRQSIRDRINEVKDLEEQQRLYEYYLNSLSRDGVSYELISKTLPMIEGEVNNILSQIVEFGMQLEMDGKNINAHIVYDDQRWSLELCSGMERFISGLAIRIALINISNLPRPNFLVIDEGFGTLDNENLTSLYMLFSYLKTQFDFVMVISHIDSMRDVVDTLMEIKKEDGFSKVKF